MRQRTGVPVCAAAGCRGDGGVSGGVGEGGGGDERGTRRGLGVGARMRAPRSRGRRRESSQGLARAVEHPALHYSADERRWIGAQLALARSCLQDGVAVDHDQQRLTVEDMAVVLPPSLGICQGRIEIPGPGVAGASPPHEGHQARNEDEHDHRDAEPASFQLTGTENRIDGTDRVHVQTIIRIGGVMRLGLSASPTIGRYRRGPGNGLERCLPSSPHDAVCR